MCSPQTAHPDANGRAAEDAALAFVRNLEAGNTPAAKSEMTAEAQAATTEPQLADFVRTIKGRGVTGSPTIVAAFVLQFTAPPQTFAFVPCSAQGSHKGMDFIGAGPAAQQGHVVLSTATTNGDSVYSIALVSNNGSWRVQRIHFDPSVMAGRDAYAWWGLAKSQAREGHALDAWLLYATAKALLSRGPDYQPVGLTELSQEMAKLPTPTELQGKPPHTWLLDGKAFKIASVGTLGVERGRAVILLVQQSPWTADAEARQLNHRLIDAYLKVHPEWAEVFDVLVSRICQPNGNRCFGTVYEKRRGYVDPPRLPRTAPAPSAS
jgi:hypothetical protein